jgi:hypothetical protein
MSKMIVTTIEFMLNRKAEPVSMKWCNEEETINQEHQISQGKPDNNLEDEERNSDSSSGVMNSKKYQTSIK